MRRQKHDGDTRGLTDFLTPIIAVKERKTDIKYNQVRLKIVDLLQNRLKILYFLDLIPPVRQVFSDQLANGLSSSTRKIFCICISFHSYIIIVYSIKYKQIYSVEMNVKFL